MESGIKKTLKKLWLITLVFLLTGIACEGPSGPQGVQGEKGEQGEQGPRGSQGEQGNANVMYSDWMDINWSSGNNTLKQMGIEEPRITQRFLSEGGIVLMFMKMEAPVQGGGTADVIIPLPYLAGNWFYGFYVVRSDDVSGINFHLQSADNTTHIPDDMWMGRHVRYLLIPGSVNLAAGKQMSPDDYAAVAKYYGLEQ